jgi:hypothetical protein
MSRHQTFLAAENTAFGQLGKLSRLCPLRRGKQLPEQNPLLPIRRSAGCALAIDFHLAFSPEREGPGNQQITLRDALPPQQFQGFVLA